MTETTVKLNTLETVALTAIRDGATSAESIERCITVATDKPVRPLIERALENLFDKGLTKVAVDNAGNSTWKLADDVRIETFAQADPTSSVKVGLATIGAARAPEWLPMMIDAALEQPGQQTDDAETALASQTCDACGQDCLFCDESADPYALIEFAEAWSGLGDAVTEQVKAVLDEGPRAQVNVNAITMALEDLKSADLGVGVVTSLRGYLTEIGYYEDDEAQDEVEG